MSGRVHPSGWNLIKLLTPTDVVAQQHVIPVDDLREHEESPSCWCRPAEDDEQPDLWAHRSLDRRELIEEGAASVQ